jgi:hypothetical protein
MEYTVNEIDLRDAIMSRQAFLGASMDNKRPRAWDQFGYPMVVDSTMLLAAYDRNGAAFGAVHQTLDRCWQDKPRFKLKGKDEETQWEKDVHKLLDDIGAWPKLHEWDRRNMVSRYAGLVLRFRDGRPPEQPVRSGAKLIDVVPMYEHQLRVASWDNDLASETYGKPTMYEYAQRDVLGADKQAKPQRFEMLHPSRVVMLAEGAVGDDFLEGVPLLKPGYNHLIDLEKVSGGSAESYLKNSARTLRFVFDKDADPLKIVGAKADGSRATADDVRRVMQDRADRVNSNIDAAIVGQGMTVDALQTSLHDPEPSFLICAEMFAASVRIPFTILFGQQTGRLASDEDKDAWNRRCTSRRMNVLTPALTALIRAMQKAGAVAAGDFEVEWPSLEAAGEDEQVSLAEKLANVNKAMVAAGRNAPFAENEVRVAAGYDEEPELDLPLVPEEDPALAEGDPERDPPEDAQPPGAAGEPAEDEPSVARRAAMAVNEMLRRIGLLK